MTWLRCLRVTDGAHQLVQALVAEPGAGPTVRLARVQVAAPLLYEQAVQSPRHVAVHRDELVGGVAGAEVVAPSPKEQVEPPDDDLQLLSHLAPTGHGLDPHPGTLHGPQRRPAVEVVAHDVPLLPQLAGHAGMEVAPEEVEALLPLPEVDHTGLVRMEGESEVTEEAVASRSASSASPGSGTAPRSRPHSGRASPMPRSAQARSKACR